MTTTMLARNSIGRSVSLLNINDSETTPATSRSTSVAILPSISSFYQQKGQAQSSPSALRPAHRKLSRTTSSFYPTTAATTSSRKSSNAGYWHSPAQSAADYSPTLSNCSTEVESAQLSPRSSFKTLAPSSSSSTAPSTLLPPLSSLKTAATTTTTSIIPHRPAGPAPLISHSKQQHPANDHIRLNFITRNCGSTSSPSSYSISNSGSLSSYYSSSSSSTTTTTTTTPSSSSSSVNSLNSSSSSISTTSSSSSTSSSSNNIHTITSNLKNQHLPLSPLSQQRRQSTHPHSHSSSTGAISTNPMDHQSKMYHNTMLSSPTTVHDPFLYGSAGMTGGFAGQRNSTSILPLSGQYGFSVAQQPLPPVSASSPIMYNTMDSPTTLSMMDPYLQQQQIPNIPFAPYPTELMPGAVPPPSSQSVAATSPSDTASSSTQPKTAKKKYPCPHAAKYNCSDTFTTSGHAARHGKKHTGEKNIHCPVCDKAFTRKDNMKQHERTHRNKGEASKVAEAVESSKRAQAALSKSSTNSSSGSNEIEMEDSPPARITDAQSTIRAAHQQRRPNISAVQPPQPPPSLTSPTAADIPMPVTLDSGEILQPVAPSLKVDPMDKTFSNIFDHSFTSRSQEMLLGRPPIFERTTSTGSGFSADGEGESPGLDALAMAAELSPV